MKPAPFKYHRVSSLPEATTLMASLDNVRILAGGQSLMPMMNMRYVMVDHLIDLNDATDLAGIQVDGDRITIGAMTRQRDILGSSDVAQHAPVIVEALRQVGHIQTRNRGTIGGSLSHLDPAAELPGPNDFARRNGHLVQRRRPTNGLDGRVCHGIYDTVHGAQRNTDRSQL